MPLDDAFSKSVEKMQLSALKRCWSKLAIATIEATESLFSSSFLLISMSSLTFLLSLSIIQVFAAVTQWIKYDLPTRKQFLSQLLEHVRLPLCEPLFLVRTVSEDMVVMADTGCRHFVDEAKVNGVLLRIAPILHPMFSIFAFQNYHLLDAYRHERLNMQGHRFRPRKVFSGEVLYAGMMKYCGSCFLF
ncbi:BTB And Kelch [Cooperia oncophora]